MNSEWMKRKFSTPGREVKEGKRVPFPIRPAEFETLRDSGRFLDDDTGRDLASARNRLAEYFIPDFANWKDHDSYQNGFERLLKDLKSPDTGDP